MDYYPSNIRIYFNKNNYKQYIVFSVKRISFILLCLIIHYFNCSISYICKVNL